MKKIIATLVVFGFAMLGSTAFAQANDLLSKEQMERRLEMQRQREETLKRMQDYRKRVGAKPNLRPDGTPIVNTVPELDPNAMGSALALLAGGALVMNGRRRRQLAD